MSSRDLHHLREREKELNCIYRVIQVLRKEEYATPDILRAVAKEIPYGWRYPGICMVGIDFENRRYTTPHFHPTRWYQQAEIVVDESVLGEIRVYYARNITADEQTLFLSEEQHLLNTLAEQISIFIFNRRLRRMLESSNPAGFNGDDECVLPDRSDQHWRWRYKMARLLAEGMDMAEMGVEAIYIIGSTKEAKAGPASDIDLLVHFTGNDQQKSKLEAWIDGWSQSLAETNYERTGFRIDAGMIDLHLITSEQLQNKSNSFAAMIGSLQNRATLLRSQKSS